MVLQDENLLTPCKEPVETNLKDSEQNSRVRKEEARARTGWMLSRQRGQRPRIYSMALLSLLCSETICAFPVLLSQTHTPTSLQVRTLIMPGPRHGVRLAEYFHWFHGQQTRYTMLIILVFVLLLLNTKDLSSQCGRASFPLHNGKRRKRSRLLLNHRKEWQ